MENQEGIYNYVKDLEDFNISKDTVTRLTVSQFTNDQNKTPAEILEDKQMLIIGFDDVYENIPENGVEAIDEFIKAGKSVIFSHDTTSLYNYNYNKDHNTVKGNVLLYDNWLISHFNGKETITNGQNWGVSMNKIRETVGMDRYGITNITKLTDGTTVSDLLKQEKILYITVVFLSQNCKNLPEILHIGLADPVRKATNRHRDIRMGR